jgi:hypothetical protein
MMAAPLDDLTLHIIYCSEKKRPLGPHGWRSAVADPASIARLERGPYIGVATGWVSGIVVLDVDPRNGGDKTFTEQLSWLPPTRTHRTKSGGQHLIYRYPSQGIHNFTGTDKNGLPGIELQSDGKGVVVPTSPGYSVIDDRPVAEFPERLRELMAPRAPQKQNNASPMVWNISPGDYRIPKPIHAEVCKLIPTPHNQRRVIGGLRELVQTTSGRNKVCFNTALLFRKGLIEAGVIAALDAADLLLMAMQANGYFSKPDGEYRAESTIRSGLGLRLDEWPSDYSSQQTIRDALFCFPWEETS